MDSADALLGGLASGDTAPAPEAPPQPDAALKREQDSTDDFEHLDRDSKQEAGESPLHQHRTATQSFLDMERDEFVDTPRAPSAADKLADQLADKFTDSESDADTAGESPLHRPEPRAEPKPSAPAPEPSAPLMLDPTPVLAPTSAVAPVAFTPAKPEIPEVHPEPKPRTPTPEPKKEPMKPEPVAPPKVEPAPQPKPAPAPVPKAEPIRVPTAHIIEAEVIFCQMGLGKLDNTTILQFLK